MLKINLRTHTVYPEIITDSNTGEWLAKLINQRGQIVNQFNGTVLAASTDNINDVVDFRRNAAKAAYAKFETVIKKYIRGKK